MRVRFVTSVACFATSFGCGDGVGHPIVERDSATPQAGASGRAGEGWGGGYGSGARGGYPVGGRGFVWGGSSGSDDVPPSEYCASVAEWPDESRAGEQLFLEILLNPAREYGYSCTMETPGVAVAPVIMKPELRCAARLHSRDMAERGFFGHVNPNDVGPEDRMRSAGYTTFRIAGESITRGEAPAGDTIPLRALEALLSAGDSECQNLLDGRFDSVGIGNYGDLWTLDFAGP